MVLTPRDLLHRWQSRIRCRWLLKHDGSCCTNPVTGWWIVDVRFAADPESYFAGYTQPEVMTARHAAPRQSLLERIKAWWKKVLGMNDG